MKELDPPVFPTIDRVEVERGREVLVTQGPVQPYTYKGQAYRRVGNTSTVMSRDEYNRVLLERLHGENRWENQTADHWQLPTWISLRSRERWKSRSAAVVWKILARVIRKRC